MTRIARLSLALLLTPPALARADPRPNVFIAISDDQSWPHASAYGRSFVDTPHFDRVAREGVLFTNAFSASPGCSPSRAALLTGLNTWQIEHAGTHGSYFHPKFETFPQRLRIAGYNTGHAGKGWGPGDPTGLGRTEDPAGPRCEHRGGKGEGADYAAALDQFLKARDDAKPFCFWFGSHDPHRKYTTGSGRAKGKSLQSVQVPEFLPDTQEVRNDLLDYAVEIERFDSDLGKMLALLKQHGELENTLVIVTSDNGMPFPRAKANCYEYGVHVPLAIRWGRGVPAGRTVDDLVGFTDLTATIYDLTGAEPPEQPPLAGRSLSAILQSEKSGVVEPQRTAIYFARERHSSSRYNTLGYPQRAIRTRNYLYIRNFKPERWPAGAPRRFDSAVHDENGRLVASQLGEPHGAYHDIDDSPTLRYLIKNREDPSVRRYIELAVALRPGEELFDFSRDPACLDNLVGKAEFGPIKSQLAERLEKYLLSTGDTRATGGGDKWENYPRVGKMRWFPLPEWATNKPELIPPQPWLDARRPRHEN